MSDPYEQCPFITLGIPTNSNEEEVMKQWRNLMRQAHPDKNPNTCAQATEQSKILNSAKDRAIEQCLKRRRGQNSWTESEWKKWMKREEEKMQHMAREFEEEMHRYHRQEAKNQEDQRHKEEMKHEEEKKRRELQEDMRRQAIPIFETIFDYMDRYADIQTAAGYRIYNSTKNDFNDAYTTRRGRQMSPFTAYGALFGMADTINRTTEITKILQANSDKTQRDLKAAYAMEHESKKDLEKKLVEIKEELEDERRSNERSKQGVVQLTKQLEAAHSNEKESTQQLSTMLDSERRANNELKQQLAAAILALDTERKAREDAERMLVKISKEKSQSSETNSGIPQIDQQTKKRKAQVPNTDVEMAVKQFQILVKEFVKAHVTIRDGDFLSSNQALESFSTWNRTTAGDSSTISDCAFHKHFKNTIQDTFSPQSGVQYTRARCNGERGWGYAGLSLK
jgi:curved DNA-binding protein CbpA